LHSDDPLLQSELIATLFNVESFYDAFPLGIQPYLYVCPLLTAVIKSLGGKIIKKKQNKCDVIHEGSEADTYSIYHARIKNLFSLPSPQPFCCKNR